jgi:heme/copper-type cytochrome/quinol oxidase subunit 2
MFGGQDKMINTQMFATILLAEGIVFGIVTVIFIYFLYKLKKQTRHEETDAELMKIIEGK